MMDAFDHHNSKAAGLSRKRRKIARREFAQAIKVVSLDDDVTVIDRKIRISDGEMAKDGVDPAADNGNRVEASLPSAISVEQQPQPSQAVVPAAASQSQPSGPPAANGEQSGLEPVRLEPPQNTLVQNGGDLPATETSTTNIPYPSQQQHQTVALVDVDDAEELRQQKLYFCSAPDPSQMCLVCAGSGHRYRQCPMLTCKFCRLPGHFASQCATRVRCPQCQQLGHDQSTCRSASQATAGPKTECAFCGSMQHLEEGCDEIWRSFDPCTEQIRKVNSISAYCGSCGAEGHYFAECKLRDPDSVATSTWCLSNREKYQDPACGEEAIEKPRIWSNRGTARGPPPRRRPGGRGMAPAAKHIRFSESDDDSESDFIRQPIRRQAPAATDRIRIASNLSLPPMPPQSTYRNGGGGLAFASRVPYGPLSLPERPAKSANWNGYSRAHDGGRGWRGLRDGSCRGAKFRGGRQGG